MKKRLLTFLLVAVIAVSVVALTACESGAQYKEAYGLVHGKGYVGQASVKIVDGKVVAAYLDEACFPNYSGVRAAAADAGDYVVTVGTDTKTYYWKTVKWADVTAVYDATNGYMIGDVKLVDHFLASEENCQKYFEAVLTGKVAVVKASGDDFTVMTAAKLLKSLNGYWTLAQGSVTAFGWADNARKTCAFVVVNGADKKITKSASAADAKVFEYKDSNGTVLFTQDTNVNTADIIMTKAATPVSTGATWTDFADYYNLLVDALAK